MLRSANELRDYKLSASDGELGRTKEFLFNDLNWDVQYLVVDTGDWLVEHLALLPPIVLGKPDWSTQLFPINLPKDWIESSPEIDEDKPVSRQKMMDQLGLKNMVIRGTISGHLHPGIAESAAQAQTALASMPKTEGDPHLRSTHEITGYDIGAIDGNIGHVEDLIVETDNWIIRYIVVDTRNWLPGGKKVLVSPEWIENISWSDQKVNLDLTQESIKNCPEFLPEMPINRDYEKMLYDFYGRPRYW